MDAADLAGRSRKSPWTTTLTDKLDGVPEDPASTDSVGRLISEQLRIMEKQLDLMRSVDVAGDGMTAAAVTLPAADEGRPEDGPRSASTSSQSLRAPSHGASVGTERHPIPMTDVQRDVWITCQLSDEGSAAYNLSTMLSLKGELSIEALRESLWGLSERHESLRTTFDATGEHQIFDPSIEIELRVVDVSDSAELERIQRVDALLDAEMTKPYDLAAGPLFRPILVRYGPLDHVLVLALHHLVGDGWSLDVLRRDLGAIYATVSQGGRPALSGATRYSDYAAWRADQSVESMPYWLGLYDDVPAQLDLPTDKARPPEQTFDFGFERGIVSGELLASIQDLAIAHGVTSFAVLLASWEVLLHRLSAQREFASGLFVSGQAAMGTRDLVGMCTNLVPLRVQIDPAESFLDYLKRSRRTAIDAIDNQHYTIGQLATELHLARDPSRPAVVSTVVTLESTMPTIPFGDLEAVGWDHGRRSYGSFDLELYLVESAEEVTVDLQYMKALFEPRTIRRWLGHYVHLLEQMTSDATAPISNLQLLDATERAELLDKWNATESPLPDRSMHERFEVQAAGQPDRTAVRTSGGSLTYGELNARANRLARHLRDLGVQSDRLVGVHLERSPDMLVALLAVHKAGGAYVPLDPRFPEERLAMIAAEAGLHVLLTQSSLDGGVVADGAALLLLERDQSLIDAHDPSDLGVPVSSSDLAYVIYTSGSTGRPKGVEVAHLALTNLLESMRLRPGLDADDALLAVTTVSFDIAGLELFLPLIVGAVVVLADEQEAVDAMWLRDRLSVGDISVVQATPATWQLLLDAGWPGTPHLKALCGGEALSEELAQALGSRVESLWNMYGPTETTIWSSVSEVGSNGGPVRLGEPVLNTELHVLDASGDLQPLGVPGELCIGGVGLARGYRDQDQLTAERFFTHRFDDGSPRRLYRTGDIVRRASDGALEYLGRADFQVKIRGYRIELGEIETALTRHADVRECAVVARDGDNGSKRLVAYVVPTSDRPASVSELRAYLRETLPDYMVPALFVVMDALPLTANKKVDRTRLPDPAGQRPDLSTELVAPETEQEAALARIWEELLGVDRVGRHDNFFDLGGDSLLALRCIMQANGSGMSLAPISLFRHQTISELALAAAETSGSMAGDQDVVTGATPLSPAQLRFLDERRTPDVHHWNISTLVQAQRLSPASLEVAVEALVRHHDALRLRLWQEEGRWQQEIAAPSGQGSFETHDLSMLSAPERSAAIEQVCTELQGSFDLGQGLLLRVAHFDCGPEEPDRLFVSIHHFAVDGVTWSVFWEDLEQAYLQADAATSVSLPPKTTSIKAWATQLERLAQTPRVLDTAALWLDMPWSEVSGLPIDFDADRASNTNGSATTVEAQFSLQETRLLLGGRMRPENVIMSALARCLSSWTSSRTVLIDVLSHGRGAALEGVNLSRTVGFTLSYDPLVLSHPTWDGTSETIESVTDQIDRGPEGFSFELLRFRASDPRLRAALTELPRADVLFNYAGADTGQEGGTLWKEAAEPTGRSESPRGIRQYPIALRALLEPNLRLIFIYSRELHKAETIEAKMAEVTEAIRAVLEEAATTA